MNSDAPEQVAELWSWFREVRTSALADRTLRIYFALSCALALPVVLHSLLFLAAGVAILADGNITPQESGMSVDSLARICVFLIGFTASLHFASRTPARCGWWLFAMPLPGLALMFEYMNNDGILDGMLCEYLLGLMAVAVAGAALARRRYTEALASDFLTRLHTPENCEQHG